MVHDLHTIEIAFMIGTDTGITYPSVWLSPMTDSAMPKEVKQDPNQWIQVQVLDPAASHRTNPYWPRNIGDKFWIRIGSSWSDGKMRARAALKTWGLVYQPWREQVTPPEYGETKKYKTSLRNIVQVQCEKIFNTDTTVYVLTCKGCSRPDVFDNWDKLVATLEIWEEVTNA